MRISYQHIVRVVAFFVFVVLLNLITRAQSATSPITDSTKLFLYRNVPLWKEMIADTNANYFEVQQAFELFWRGKELPEEEEEVIGEKRKLKNNLINRTFNAGELKAQRLREELAFDYKRYQWWLIKTEPFVKDDGAIMTPTERIQLWKKHYDELKEQKTK